VVALDARDRVTGMARGPKRSAIAAMAATFFNWAPVRAARTFLGHIGLMLVCMGGIWLAEQIFHAFFSGQEPKFFALIPVKWFFDAGEVGILVVFVIAGIYDAWRQLMR
jgi:hypothetical protein